MNAAVKQMRVGFAISQLGTKNEFISLLRGAVSLNLLHFFELELNTQLKHASQAA